MSDAVTEVAKLKHEINRNVHGNRNRNPMCYLQNSNVRSWTVSIEIIFLMGSKRVKSFFRKNYLGSFVIAILFKFAMYIEIESGNILQTAVSERWVWMQSLLLSLSTTHKTSYTINSTCVKKMESKYFWSSPMNLQSRPTSILKFSLRFDGKWINKNIFSLFLAQTKGLGVIRLLKVV